MNQTTREEGDPTYDPLDEGGMCGVFLIVSIVIVAVIVMLVIYAN